MRVSVLVAVGPHHPAAAAALKYCQALLNTKHTLNCVFFYQDGVLLGNAQTYFGPNEQQPVAQAWQDFVAAQDINAVLCTASAVRRGIFDAQSAEQYNRNAITIANHFQLGGLGEWAEAIRQSERAISFQ
ncbi:MAG TPA: sulfurtransferase complex subunit TusD [Alcanivoracaceae bacterium]|nr:sulfurtransferase complex subunit TusD [Alcanivoracaceae bacterium]